MNSAETAATGVRCYSIRRLSPYQGTVQVLEIPGFRAMSADGARWRVQFLNQRSRFASYGIWRADGGGNLIETERTRAIVGALRTHAPLPFPLADSLELWLLDAKDALPLALLASTLPERSPLSVPHARWQVAISGDQGFVAPSLGGSASAGTSAIGHDAVLARCVQKAAGPQPTAQWFRRDADGSGARVAALGTPPAPVSTRLAKQQFPELLLRDDWPSAQERDLVNDYHVWHSPHLLTHTNLTRGTRDRMERAACTHAQRLYRVRHLLPEVVNSDLVDIALVEAVIRRSA